MLTENSKFETTYDTFIGNVHQWLIWEKHIKCVIYDQICEPLHFCYILGATLKRIQSNPYYLHHHGIVCRLWTFNVSPLLGIIRLTLPWLSALHGPSSKFDVALGRRRWLRDIAPRRPVERAPRRSPAGHPEHTAAGRNSDPARGRGDYSLHCVDERSAHTTWTGVRCWCFSLMKEKLRRVGSKW